jgi:hypothetical protein
MPATSLYIDISFPRCKSNFLLNNICFFEVESFQQVVSPKKDCIFAEQIYAVKIVYKFLKEKL